MGLNRIFIHIHNGVPQVYMEHPYDTLVLVAVTDDAYSEPVIRLVDAQPTHSLRDEQPCLYQKILGVIGQG